MKKILLAVIVLSMLIGGFLTGFAQEPARVVIDANSSGQVISPLLFGDNLEHTRRAIWQGISAEMIDNRKFAAADCGLPMGWTTLTGRGVLIDDKVAYACMAQMSKVPTMNILPSLLAERQLLDQANKGKKRVGIVFYEWNTMWDRPGDVISGVFAAGMLNMFCREAENLKLELTGYFQPVTEGAIKVDPLTSELEADGEVFALFAPHQGNRLLRTSSMAADADIDLGASIAPDGKSIYITAINRNTASDRTLELSSVNFTSQANVPAKFLIPLTQEAGGKFVQHEEKLKVSDGDKLKLKIPACTVVGMIFSININN